MNSVHLNRDTTVIQWMKNNGLADYVEAYIDIQKNNPDVLSWFVCLLVVCPQHKI